METVRFGLVGAGGIAQAYAQAFAQSESCDLIAVADIRKESAIALAEAVAGKPYENYRDLAENEDLDVLIVATPPSSHPEISNYFMNRGTSVLCEKPLCLTSAEAELMISTANSNDVQFTMASKFRYCEDVIKAKGIVASGILGEIIQFENAFTSKVDMTKRWNSDVDVSGGGVMIDNGTHSVDIIRYFLGGIHAILAVEAGSTQDLPVDENVKLIAKTQSGVTASVDLTWGINKELPYFLSVYGTGGALHVGWRESKYKLSSSPNWTVFGGGYDKVASFRGKIENFAASLSGKEELLTKPSDALASVQVIEAAYKSLNQNLWQKVVENKETAN